VSVTLNDVSAPLAGDRQPLRGGVASLSSAWNKMRESSSPRVLPITQYELPQKIQRSELQV